jgi:hypothetical protein
MASGTSINFYEGSQNNGDLIMSSATKKKCVTNISHNNNNRKKSTSRIEEKVSNTVIPELITLVKLIYDFPLHT